jgi:peptide/nickel transport system substrate-binding protein
MKREHYLLFISLTLMILLIGCSNSTVSENTEGDQKQDAKQDGVSQESGEKVLRIAQTYDIDKLDPAKMTSVTDSQLAWNLYDSLLFLDIEAGELVEGLAKSYSISDDGLVYTFQLLEGVQFHKGYGEMTSEDVKFTIDRILDPATQARNQGFLSSIKEVRSTDTYTVEIELNTLDPMLLNNLAQYWTGIVSKKAVEEKGENFSHDPIGTGPFVFEEWKPQTSTTLVKNVDWYRGEIAVDRVRFVPIPEPSTMYLAFENGDVDIIQITDPQRYEQYDNDSKFNIESVPGYIVRFIGMNNQMEPFDDPKVRQAFLYGFDRETLINTAFENLSTLAVGPIPPNVAGFEGDVKKFSYDPEKAKQLLAEAGHPNGLEVKMSIPNIDRFIIPATTFQADMKKIGVKIDVDIMETSAYLAKVREGKVPLFSHSKGQTAVPDLVLNGLFHSSNFAPGDNLTFYRNSDVDQWLDKSSTTLDENKRQELFSKIQKQLAEDVSYLFIDHEKMIFALSNRVDGFVATPTRSLQAYNVDINE